MGIDGTGLRADIGGMALNTEKPKDGKKTGTTKNQLDIRSFTSSGHPGCLYGGVLTSV